MLGRLKTQQGFCLVKYFSSGSLNPLPNIPSSNNRETSLALKSFYEKSRKTPTSTSENPFKRSDYENALSFFRDHPNPKFQFWLFENMALKAPSNPPPSLNSYQIILNNCVRCNSVKEGIAIMNHFQDSGTPMTAAIFSHYVKLLCHYLRWELEVNDRHQSKEFHLLKEFYLSHRNFLQNRQSFVKVEPYSELSSIFCHYLDPLAVEVLQDMLLASYEPSASLCQELLSTAISVRNVAVLNILANWYLNNFVDVRLEYGILQRILQTASASGDHNLITLGLQLLLKNGYSMEGHHFYGLIRSSILSKDYANAIETLGMMSYQRTQFIQYQENNILYESQIQQLLVSSLISSNNPSAPQLLCHDLNLLSISAVPILVSSYLEVLMYFGRDNEALMIFSNSDLEKSPLIYLGMMRGLARKPSSSNLLKLFSLIQEVERFEDSPSSYCIEEAYSILIDALSKQRRLPELRQVMEHCRKYGISLKPLLARKDLDFDMTKI